MFTQKLKYFLPLLNSINIYPYMLIHTIENQGDRFVVNSVLCQKTLPIGIYFCYTLKIGYLVLCSNLIELGLNKNFLCFI